VSTTPTVILQSITGVDVELRIAGPGSRSYAFVIDWHIRLVLALAWWFAALMLYSGGLPFFGMGTPRGSGYFFIVLLPPSVIYFLYHPILEIAMHGRTPGKRIARVRLVSRSGDIPGPGALLVRNVFRIIDSLPFVYLIGLGCVMFTSQHVRIGDLAAGTLLVLDDSESDKSFGNLATATGTGGLSPQAADLAHELLDRWNALDEPTRANLARSLIARIDPSTSIAELADETAAQLQSHLRTLLAQSKPA
jgi:uncharacterized RDD family membrane protein YckC